MHNHGKALVTPSVDSANASLFKPTCTIRSRYSRSKSDLHRRHNATMASCLRAVDPVPSSLAMANNPLGIVGGGRGYNREIGDTSSAGSMARTCGHRQLTAARRHRRCHRACQVQAPCVRQERTCCAREAARV